SFVLLNEGDHAPPAPQGLLVTIALKIGQRTTYALEAAIFVTGAGVQWLRDGLGVIERADETEALAASLDDNDGVYFVPALTGLWTLDRVGKTWRERARYEPSIDAGRREELLHGWTRAVERARGWEQG